MRRIRFLLAALLLCIFAASVQAHEVRPGYLAVRQIDTERFDVLWKVPAKGGMRLGLYARLPDNCSALAPTSSYFGGGASVERWSVTCPGGLTGRTIAIDGLSGTMTDVLVRIERSDGTTLVTRLSPADSSFVAVISLTHYGNHRLKLYRVNDEYADLYEGLDQDSRDLNEPPSNIDGALGVFSAFAADSAFFRVH